MQAASSGMITARSHHRKVGTLHYTLSYELQEEEYSTDRTILLLHRLPGGAFSWRNITPPLAAHCTVYAFDILCFGISDHPWPADISIWGQDIGLALCLYTLNLSNIVLVGHDVGGVVAQVLATRMAIERVRAVVLISTATGDWKRG